MNQLSAQKRNFALDFLKGIAIIAVVIYHFAGTVLPFGYLGVEIFLVISGYLLMNSILKAIDKGNFSFLRQLSNRTLRLLPSVLAVGILSFIFGFFVMLPDDFENLSQSIIASTGFVNNILAAITTKNYWDVVNLYKPLMHTWYLGILMQAYIVIIGAAAVCNRLFKNKITAIKWLTIIITVLSLGLYLIPAFSTEWKFYFLPFRLFEITAGSCLALLVNPQKSKCSPVFARIGKTVCVITLLAIITVNSTFVSAQVKLLTAVASTVIYTYLSIICPAPSILVLKPVEFLGRNSFPIYITHQSVVAFFYYSFIYETTPASSVIFICVVALMSLLVYFLAEKPANRLLKAKKQKALWITCMVAAVVLCTASGIIYLNAGVVRDVPELSITKDNIYRGMHASYCDIPYSWDKDFTDSDKTKILVLGDSFGRDWANILNESEISENIEISYIHPNNKAYNDKILRRAQAADIVFCSTSSLNDISDFFLENIPAEKLWMVGYKNFGKSNGFIYRQRFSSDYHSKTQTIPNEALAFNNEMKEKYNTHYIDMLEPVLQEGNQVRVFTNDGRFISQDCRHLTQAGAQFYAEKLDFSTFLH